MKSDLLSVHQNRGSPLYCNVEWQVISGEGAITEKGAIECGGVLYPGSGWGVRVFC